MLTRFPIKNIGSQNLGVTHSPVLGPRIEPEINTNPNKSDRIPELESNAHAGTRAAYRP